MKRITWIYSFIVGGMIFLWGIAGFSTLSSNTPKVQAQVPNQPNQLVFSTTRNGNVDIWMMGLDGQEARALIATLDSMETSPACDPQGNYLIFTAAKNGDREIYRADYRGTERRPLTDTEGENFDPVWSPIEQQVVFVSSRYGDADIWVMDSGGGNIRQITTSAADDIHPSWSPDGQKLIYSANRDGNFDLFEYTLETNEEVQLTFTAGINELYPIYRPDGQAIYYVQPEAGLYQLDRATGRSDVVLVEMRATLATPAWFYGNEMLISRTEDGETDLLKVDVETGESRSLTQDGADNLYGRACYLDPTIMQVIAAQPTLPPPTATPLASPTPTMTVTPFLTPTSPVSPIPNLPPPVILPAQRLSGLTQIWQLYNRCSASALTMLLSYFNTGVTREQSIRWLNPDPSDVSVRLEEMVPFIEQQGLQAVIRTGGTFETLKALVSAGFPVLVENTYYHEGQTWQNWMSHNRVIMGYDSNYLYTYDSLLGSGANGEGRPIAYQDFDELWRHFNRVYLVAYRPGDEVLLQRALGEHWDATYNHQFTLSQAQADFSRLNDSFSLFNIGAAQAALNQMDEAASTFDLVRQQGLPWRFFWYRFDIFDTYLTLGRYNDVLALSREVFNSTDGVDEMYYYIARAYDGLGEYERAATNYNFLIERTDGRYPEAQTALAALQIRQAQPTATPPVPLPPLVVNIAETTSAYQTVTSPPDEWLRSRETWIGEEFMLIVPSGLTTSPVDGVLVGNELRLSWTDAVGDHVLTLALEIKNGALNTSVASYTINQYWVETQIDDFVALFQEKILLNSLRPGSYYLEGIETTTTNLTFVLRMPPQSPKPAPGQYLPHGSSTIPTNWFISTEIWTATELYQLAQAAGFKGLNNVQFVGTQIEYGWQDENGDHTLVVELSADSAGDLLVSPINYELDGVAGDVNRLDQELYLIRESLLLNSIPPGEFFFSRSAFNDNTIELVFLIPAQ